MVDVLRDDRQSLLPNTFVRRSIAEIELVDGAGDAEASKVPQRGVCPSAVDGGPCHVETLPSKL